MTRPTIGLTSQATARFVIDGTEYKIALMDERPDSDIDPTLLVFRGLEEEAILTFHILPDANCHEDDHPVARPIEEDAP